LNEPFLPPSHRDLKSSSSSGTAADSMAKTNKQTQAKQEERGVKLLRGGKDLPTYPLEKHAIVCKSADGGLEKR